MLREVYRVLKVSNIALCCFVDLILSLMFKQTNKHRDSLAAGSCRFRLAIDFDDATCTISARRETAQRKSTFANSLHVCLSELLVVGVGVVVVVGFFFALAVVSTAAAAAVAVRCAMSMSSKSRRPSRR